MSIRIYGNRLLQTVPGLATRPTPARVRESVFNILQDRIQGSRWLDLCSGAGTMGAEALCRGAIEVVGIENSRAACRVIRANWEKVVLNLHPQPTFRLIQADVRQTIQRDKLLGIFDIIYFDPPYSAGLYDTVIPGLVPWLDPEGILMVEHRSSEPLQTHCNPLSVNKTYVYGTTSLTCFSPNAPQ
ncbi:MAG: 16S rRNA (guanine(966)-N(2))-methyltransferase RsmD [Synechococcaceae cyanobacterium SM2_3_2]|nr:16S rRNA (guanine(966)-N(2))-methyltransferase RsmD [Synechococcaceae cyanobacterium SM2_3_2]